MQARADWEDMESWSNLQCFNTTSQSKRKATKKEKKAKVYFST